MFAFTTPATIVLTSLVALLALILAVLLATDDKSAARYTARQRLGMALAAFTLPTLAFGFLIAGMEQHRIGHPAPYAATSAR